MTKRFVGILSYYGYDCFESHTLGHDAGYIEIIAYGDTLDDCLYKSLVNTYRSEPCAFVDLENHVNSETDSSNDDDDTVDKEDNSSEDGSENGSEYDNGDYNEDDNVDEDGDNEHEDDNVNDGGDLANYYSKETNTIYNTLFETVRENAKAGKHTISKYISSGCDSCGNFVQDYVPKLLLEDHEFTDVPDIAVLMVNQGPLKAICHLFVQASDRSIMIFEIPEDHTYLCCSVYYDHAYCYNFMDHINFNFTKSRIEAKLSAKHKLLDTNYPINKFDSSWNDNKINGYYTCSIDDFVEYKASYIIDVSES
jgi:hypothetical protein